MYVLCVCTATMHGRGGVGVGRALRGDLHRDGVEGGGCYSHLERSGEG